jgi:hypothetical protein
MPLIDDPKSNLCEMLIRNASIRPSPPIAWDGLIVPLVR